MSSKPTLQEWVSAVQRAAGRLPDPVSVCAADRDYDEWRALVAECGEFRPNEARFGDRFAGYPLGRGAAYTHVVDRSGRTAAVVHPQARYVPGAPKFAPHLAAPMRFASEPPSPAAALLCALADVCEKHGASFRMGAVTGCVTVCLNGEEIWNGYPYPKPWGEWRAAAARMGNNGRGGSRTTSPVPKFPEGSPP